MKNAAPFIAIVDLLSGLSGQEPIRAKPNTTIEPCAHPDECSPSDQGYSLPPNPTFYLTSSVRYRNCDCKKETPRSEKNQNNCICLHQIAETTL